MVRIGLIRTFLSVALVVMVLSACTGTGEQTASPPEIDDSVSSRSETADSGVPDGGEDVAPPSGEMAPEQPGEEAAPDLGVAPGLILVTGGNGEVTLVDPATEAVRQLRAATANAGPSLQPTWAPAPVDGQMWVAWSEQAADGTFQIVLADALGGVTTTFDSPVAPFYYYWSSDGSLLGFLGQNAFSPLQMGVVDLPGGSLEVVGEGQPFYFDWQPDSHAMVTHTDGGLSMLTRLDGRWESKRLGVKPGLFQAPAWTSADRILVTVLASGSQVEVDLERTAAAQDDLSPQELAIIDTRGRLVDRLGALEGPAAFVVDPEGGQAAYTVFGGPLRIVDLSTGESMEVSQKQAAAFQWSHDGRRLLFMEVDAEERTLAPKVWDGNQTLVFPSFFPTRVFLLQYLPFWDQYSRSLSLWSPSGDAFTYPASSPGGDRIMVQRLGEPGPVEVSKGVFASWSPAPLQLEVPSGP